MAKNENDSRTEKPATFYQMLRDLNEPWSKKLMMAAAVRKNHGNVFDGMIFESICAGLVNPRKSKILSSDLESIWGIVLELLKTSPNLPMRSSFINTIIKALDANDTQYNIANLRSVIDCLHLLMKRPDFGTICCGSIDVLKSLVVGLLK